MGISCAKENYYDYFDCTDNNRSPSYSPVPSQESFRPRRHNFMSVHFGENTPEIIKPIQRQLSEDVFEQLTPADIDSLKRVFQYK